MTIQSIILKHRTRMLFGLFWLLISSLAQAADLVFTPATPIVEIGQQITLSVSDTSGEITWNPTKGRIQGTGNEVTYIVPEQAGLDVVTVFDGEGNVGFVKITVIPKQLVSLENATWEVFTNRSNITALALSEDGETLWVGTNGRLEQRDASTGELVQVFTNLDGLPSNRIWALESDGSGGLWIGTDEGLAYLSVSGEWTVYTTDNSGLPFNNINALENNGSDKLWVGTEGGDFQPKNQVCIQINTEKCEALLTGKRATIIIAGGGAQSTNSLHKFTLGYYRSHF
ncbi:two-component regulator propeller domain-containing protein [Candidatus Parabeggiatoa sp. HSG14]|uniref:two-component regulator propeller domain-containing protein n=1 Tax=Candidatus Parabeggiatoa sp. HSG14 TaxID=3055593 RepID=UPI0025A8FA35|nr:two-component regulator propeller domain-containing protein [Thiotrichales bacterium HSG14]